jgi:sRNA-binding carbon storage regulator CsrA
MFSWGNLNVLTRRNNTAIMIMRLIEQKIIPLDDDVFGENDMI